MLTHLPLLDPKREVSRLLPIDLQATCPRLGMQVDQQGGIGSPGVVMR